MVNWAQYGIKPGVMSVKPRGTSTRDWALKNSSAKFKMVYKQVGAPRKNGGFKWIKDFLWDTHPLRTALQAAVKIFKYPKPKRPVDTIVVHHSVMNQGMSRNVAMPGILAAHKKNGLAYDGMIAYHHVIGDNWEAPGRPIETIGYHAGKWSVNVKSIAVCMMGNFEHDKLTSYQQDRLRNRLQYWSDLYRLDFSAVTRHKDHSATACPGKNLSKTVLKNLYNRPRK